MIVRISVKQENIVGYDTATVIAYGVVNMPPYGITGDAVLLTRQEMGE